MSWSKECLFTEEEHSQSNELGFIGGGKFRFDEVMALRLLFKDLKYRLLKKRNPLQRKARASTEIGSRKNAAEERTFTIFR